MRLKLFFSHSTKTANDSILILNLILKNLHSTLNSLAISMSSRESTKRNITKYNIQRALRSNIATRANILYPSRTTNLKQIDDLILSFLFLMNL